MDEDEFRTARPPSAEELMIGVALAALIFSQTIPTVASTPPGMSMGPCGETTVAYLPDSGSVRRRVGAGIVQR
jgi:hypothetical protein